MDYVQFHDEIELGDVNDIPRSSAAEAVADSSVGSITLSSWYPCNPQEHTILRQEVNVQVEGCLRRVRRRVGLYMSERL